MGETTTPIFIVGSGRSGTKAIVDSLSTAHGIEAHHEYLTTLIQPLSAKFFMGKISRADALLELERIYGSALYWSDAKVFVDASHKLSWLIPLLHQTLPQAKFVWIRRDGRKVATSFFRKLGHEIYEPVATQKMLNWLDNEELPEPPNEKKYWWNIPRGSQPFAERFVHMKQFERCAYHWVSAHTTIRKAFADHVPEESQMSLKLEELVTIASKQQELAEFIGRDVNDLLKSGLAKPKHVIVARDFEMTQQERLEFEQIANHEMHLSGYSTASAAYQMTYDDGPR